MKYLALDFDGVIVDSINECLATALNAYTRFCGKDQFCTDLRLVPEGLADAFRSMRPLIRRGEDYVFLIQAFEEQRDLAGTASESRMPRSR